MCSFISIYFIYQYLNNEYSTLQGILIGTLTGLCLLLSTITRRIAYLKIYLLRDKLNCLFIYLIQKKILKLKISLKDEEISTIINLLSSDLETIRNLSGTVDMCSACLTIMMCVSILVWILGPVGIVGFLLSLFHVPLIFIFSSFMFSAKSHSRKFTDSRTGILKNFIESAQILKIFAWEKPFKAKIIEERRKEKSYLFRYDHLKGLLQSLILGGITLSIFSTISLNMYFGEELNIGQSLLIIGCLYTLQLFIPYVLLLGLSNA